MYIVLQLRSEVLCCRKELQLKYFIPFKLVPKCFLFDCKNKYVKAKL